MIRILLVAAVLAVLPWLAPRPGARAKRRTDPGGPGDARRPGHDEPKRPTIRGGAARARAVMICPRVFKAGFFLGGEGGDCVLLARAGNGTWSYPAFYGMGSGSFGLQIGIQDASSS